MNRTDKTPKQVVFLLLFCFTVKQKASRELLFTIDFLSLVVNFVESGRS